MTTSALFVAPASRRRFFRVAAPRKTAGETPAPPNLFTTICFANLWGVAGTLVAHEG